MKNNWLQNKPVQHWYQIQGIENGMKPIHKHDQGGVNRGYLLRETPQRLLSWNDRKKSLSPGCKEMLLEKMKEIEAFNASRVSAKAKNQGKGSASTQKEKRADNYNTRKSGEKTCQYSEREDGKMLHMQYSGHRVCVKRPNKKKENYEIGKHKRSFVVNEHNKFLDKYFESIEPKDEGSLVKGLEELEWDRKDVHDYVDEEYISWNGSLYSTKKFQFQDSYFYDLRIRQHSVTTW
ncbi:hypothetical protein Tco_0780519 [Tanacetum coccineum]